MTTETEIIARANELLSAKPSFLTDDGQLVEEMSTVIGVGVNMAVTESHNDRNEFFSDLAQLESSKLAKASDEGRVPNRPLPQIVKCEITSSEYVEFNGDSVVLSDISTKYLFDGVVVVDNETIQADLRQEEKKTYSYIPTTQEWQEFVVGGKKTSRFFVYVSGMLWEDFENMGDLKAEDEGYITRYNTLGQLYIRTGNGFLGKVPDGPIEVVSYDTESVDIQVGAPLQAEGIEQSVEFKVIEIVQSSQPQESAVSVSKGLPYWKLKSGGSGYNTDYEDDVRGQFPETLFVKAWGEKRESVTYDRDNINIIFISALREENRGVFGEEVITFLKEKKHLLQVEFEWRDPSLIESSATITGQIENTKNIASSIATIKTEIVKIHGLYADESTRRDKIYKSSFDEIISKTLVFQNLLPNKNRKQMPQFESEITGSQIPSGPREIIYLTNDSITVNITLIDNA